MYHAMQTVGGVDEYHWRIAFDNQLLEHKYVADLLNRQAEDLEVLREWIRDCGQQMIRDEKEIVDDPEFSTPEDVAEGKRRIAALEGE